MSARKIYQTFVLAALVVANGACNRPLGGQANSGPYVFRVQQLAQPQDDSLGLTTLRLSIGLADGKSDPLWQGAANKIAYQQRVYQLSYQLQENIYLEQDGGRLPCVLYHFERSYDLRPERVVVLAFETKKPGRPSSLIIDSELFANQPVQVKL
jgi:hypothetical protein